MINPSENVAEVLVQQLAAQGVDWIFLNPGSDTPPIQEAILSLTLRGYTVPRIQLCPDERIAMSAAQAYWLLTGRPQCVVVHVDVGTLALGATLHNAQRVNTGVVVIAGLTPRTYDGSLPGGRTIAVQWQQDQPDQTGFVRSLVKWADEIVFPETSATTVSRAFQVAQASPPGPVYLTVSRETLLMPVPERSRRLPMPERHRAPRLPVACKDTIGQLAEWLLEAERPVIITARIGRQPEGVAALQELASLAGIPIFDSREKLNIASDHPCYIEDYQLGFEHIRQADLILVLDSEVPWVPLVYAPGPATRVAQIDIDPIKADMKSWLFEVDLPIQADSILTLPLLTHALKERADATKKRNWQERLDKLTDNKRAREQQRLEAVAAFDASGRVTAESVCYHLSNCIPTDSVVFEEATTNDMVVREYLAREEPGSIHAISAAGLGWVMGASFGAKLVHPDRDVIGICGDGTFMFSAPLAALWTARDAGVGYLTVILNNSGYRASKNPVVQLFPEGASVQNNDFTGTVFRHMVDYAAASEACGAKGFVVEKAEQIIPTIQEALSHIRKGVCAVIDMRLDSI